jgi:hypothetical protein
MGIPMSSNEIRVHTRIYPNAVSSSALILNIHETWPTLIADTAYQIPEIPIIRSMHPCMTPGTNKSR